MLRTTVRLPTVPFVTPPHVLSRAIIALGSIHHIGKIRNFLSRSATERLIHAFVLQNAITAKAFFTVYPPMS